jgi:hypothetical protein
MNQMIRRLFVPSAIALLFVLGVLFPVAAEEPAAPPAAKPNVIRIEALIDGKSRLLLKGKTAQWHHLEWAAPGRHEDTKHPTVLNGEKWFPEWPDRPDEENRNCKCKSDKYEKLEPAVPDVVETATVKRVQGRGKVTIVQQPKPDNDHTLIVEFDDNSQGGHNPYVVDVSWNPTSATQP